MEKSLKRASGSTENSRLLGIVAAVVVIATLYFARIVFIPLALALLLSLVLSPPVAFLERIKLPRALAIFLVVILMVGVMGLVGWKTSQQFVDLTDQLPSYRQTLEDKIRSLKGPGSQSIHKASDTVKELSREITAVSPGAVPSSNETKRAAPAPGTSVARPIAVELVAPGNPLES